MIVDQAPALGAAAALVVVIGYLLYSNWRDRGQQQDVMRGAFERIAVLETKVADLEKTVDHERELRHLAEDAAAAARRDAGDVRARLDAFTKGRGDEQQQ